MSGIYLKWSQTQSYSDDSNNTSEENCHTSYLEKRRKALFGQRRQLSPFERVSGMVAQDKEDMLLGKQKQEVDPVCDQSRQSRVSLVENLSSESSINKNNLEKHTVHEEMRDIHLATKKTGILIDGEYIYVMMENIKTNTHLQDIFLLEAGRKFQCRYGSLNHTEIVGHLPGKIFLTDKGYPVLVRRPTLEEYVLHMKRTATISYPKDCAAMLMMLDASPGDVILEAGTGSGAMTLHLSRAVWTAGTVYTFETNSNHQKVAKSNIQTWKTSYNMSHAGQPWPDNICFQSGHLQDTGLQNDSVDGAVIDLEDPHLVIQTVANKLKRGRAASIYVSNLSQVVDITEVIRINKLPLTVDSVIDVTHKHWQVHPARRRRDTSPLDRLKFREDQRFI
ncbi:putative tRNA (adenine(58)-N(1))-methyltransferase, mitochondrial [Apostichopus japonicus]|uniref:tRNA (adenine(58)-N(1))-methyltransferase n=1 Tax=Stichopus japonicus TaxID=307972 RepID=A0A2G8LIF8_STIJA|nr:putative tRNA (adenine(58)-N(1))-methyltransferase, mitochondrial [Apostichopus japonicus]